MQELCIVKQRDVDPLKGVEIIGPFLNQKAVSDYAQAHFEDWPFWQASSMTFVPISNQDLVDELKRVRDAHTS